MEEEEIQALCHWNKDYQHLRQTNLQLRCRVHQNDSLSKNKEQIIHLGVIKHTLNILNKNSSIAMNNNEKSSSFKVGEKKFKEGK